MSISWHNGQKIPKRFTRIAVIWQSVERQFVPVAFGTQAEVLPAGVDFLVILVYQFEVYIGFPELRQRPNVLIPCNIYTCIDSQIAIVVFYCYNLDRYPQSTCGLLL